MIGSPSWPTLHGMGSRPIGRCFPSVSVTFEAFSSLFGYVSMPFGQGSVEKIHLTDNGTAPLVSVRLGA